MPRPDGTLYNFEKAKLKPKVEPAPKKKPELKVLPDLPKDDSPRYANGRKVHPLHPSQSPIARNGKPARIAITPELIETILNNIQVGMTVESSCILAGITKEGVERWLKTNPALRHRFTVAELNWEKEIVSSIKTAATRDHRAGQWLLERRASSRWAPVSKQELTGRNGGPVQEITIAKQLLGNVAGGDGTKDSEGKASGPVTKSA